MRARIVCLLAALGAAALPSTANAATAQPAPAGSSRHAEALREAWDPAFRIEGTRGQFAVLPEQARFAEAVRTFRARSERFDFRELGELTRAAMRAFSDLEPAPHPASGDGEDAGGDGSVHVAIHAGDLDGDGLEDIFDLLFSETSAAAVARTGDTGVELWRMPLPGIDTIITPLADANDDGRDDVLLLELNVEPVDGTGGCLPLAACLAAEGQRFTWTLSVRSGLDGASLWTQGYPGVITAAGIESGADSVGVYAANLAGVNALVVPVPGGDHDADGAPDLVVNAFDLVRPFGFGGVFHDALFASAILGGQLTATRAQVLSARTGAPIYERVTATAGVSYLEPVGDLTGDGVSELLWDDQIAAAPVGGCSWPVPPPDGICASPGVERRSIELIDGASLASRWTRELSDSGYVYAAGGDGNGDGIGELIHLGYVDEQPLTSLLSGASGATVSTAPEFGFGVVTPSGADQPVLVSLAIIWSEAGFDYEIRRRDAATGELLSAAYRLIEIPNDSWEIFIEAQFDLIADADLDATRDVFEQIFVHGNSTTIDLFVTNGVTGDLLRRNAGPDAPIAVPFPDIDGDRASDLLEVGLEDHRRSIDVTSTGVRLIDEVSVWTSARSVFASVFIWYDIANDLSGAGGADLLLSWTQFPTDSSMFESMSEAIEQTSGVQLWQIGDTLSIPGPTPTGAIHGTLTGDSAAFFGGCVFASEIDGKDFHGVFASSATGAYVLAELVDGTYLIEFADCFFGTYTAEYYDDVTDPSQATLITVTDGGVVSGIDADLAPAT